MTPTEAAISKGINKTKPSRKAAKWRCSPNLAILAKAEFQKLVHLTLLVAFIKTISHQLL